MVNTERVRYTEFLQSHYNILNIVVNTEQSYEGFEYTGNYNILNIVVNTEQSLCLVS